MASTEPQASRETTASLSAAGAPLEALASDMALVERGTGIARREGWGTILLRGPHAAEFLGGITTNHVKALPEGALQHQLICANKGKILFAVSVVRTKAEDYLLLTEPGEQDAVAGHVEFYHVREDFQMGQVGFARVDLIGAGVSTLLTSHGISERSASGRFGAGPLVTVPDPLGALPRVVALLPEGEADRFVSELTASEDAREIGPTAYEEARIWAGVPRAGLDFTNDFLPAEAALYNHLSFNKGCYVGQEIHARMHHRGHPNRKLMAVDAPDAEGAELTRDRELFHEGQVAGRITSMARLPRGGRRRGIALMRFATVQAKANLSLSPGSPPIVQMLPLSTDLGVTRA